MRTQLQARMVEASLTDSFPASNRPSLPPPTPVRVRALRTQDQELIGAHILQEL